MIDLNRQRKIRNLRIRREVDRDKVREFLVCAGFAFLVALLMFLYSWQQQNHIDHGYKLEALKRQRDALQEERRWLEIERASLASPQRIDQLARQQGFQEMTASQMVLLAPAPGEAEVRLALLWKARSSDKR
ncbi:MAG: cell division protein FtsL [Acidobacteria bacterium]|nr:cell division protein FtsL [Acidobacteriota bacterium]